jgi:alpha-mannosidase
VVSLLIESAAPGCNRLTREVRLTAGFDCVELINVVDKQRAPITPRPGDHTFAQKGGKESVNFGFPFQVPNGDVQIDLPIGAMRPAHDQIPGACKNWFTVGRWIDVANADYGVTCVTLDAPLIEVGGITATMLGSQRDPTVWRKQVDPTQTFYSWVMNNHWGTNYRAYQEGPTTFRYVLQPHRQASPAAATRLATGFTQPLLVRPAVASAGPAAPRLRLSTDDVVVTTLKPSDDGRAWIVRLYGASGKDTSVTLSWGQPGPTRVSLSDTSEKPGNRIDGAIAVPAWDIVTLRAEQPE